MQFIVQPAQPAAQREAAESSRQHLAVRLGRDPEVEPVIGAGKDLVARQTHNGSRAARSIA